MDEGEAPPRGVDAGRVRSRGDAHSPEALGSKGYRTERQPVARSFDSLLKRAGRILADAALDALRHRSSGPADRTRATGATTPHRGSPVERAARRSASGPSSPHSPAPGASPGRSIRDVPLSEALAHASYSPDRDGEADPGEIVWTWVPYEEDATRGKDRPVLVLGAGGGGVYIAQLTSKDHDRDAAQEARWGRYWLDIGSGPWDPKGRPSEVRLDRALWVGADEIRREGAILPRAMWERVLAAMRERA